MLYLCRKLAGMTTECNEIITGRKPLIGMSEAELREAVKVLGMPAFTASQIAKWLYQSPLRSHENENKMVLHTNDALDFMTNISKKNREILAQHYCIGTMAPASCQKSKDGTIKYLFPVSSGKFVETVYIPDHERATLCVSCQVGCKMNCLFCQTGKQGFEGNLTAGDIINQILSLPERETLTNIVFMGQGEPMDNMDAVIRAIEILTEKWGMAWSPRRITVSSVGIKGKLQEFIERTTCHIAISMHSPIHEQRISMMPAEKGMPIADVIEMLRAYGFSHHGRRLSFEYLVFDGLNDSKTHAKEIAKLLRGLDCRVNLIRYHKVPGVPLMTSNETKMQAMCDYLNTHGITTTIRASRGEDILAACGLLSTAQSVEEKNK